MYWLYSAMTVVALVVSLPYFLYQAFRNGKYWSTVPQRLGRLPLGLNDDGRDSIWIHAVSVGEVLTVKALLPQLRERYPRYKLFLSTTTQTGQLVARSNVQPIDGVFYFPFDFAWCVNRTLDVVNPRLLVLMETEIWPNLLRACHDRGIKTILVNGRISARSFPRYRLVRPLFGRVLDHLDEMCAQSEESARRLVALGADPARVRVTGSLKFDSLDRSSPVTGRGPDRVVRYFRYPDATAVLLAASTHRGEEVAVLRAFRRVKAAHPQAALVLAPRHPERFDEAVQLAANEGFTVTRRSDLVIDSHSRADVVVLDRMGELARLFQVATVVFVGGSLVDVGGHNVLEPAVFGKPIVVGPYMHNFKEITATFLESEALVQVPNERALDEALSSLLGDPVRRARLGAAARALVEANRGASTRTLDAIARLLPLPSTMGVVRPFRRVR